MGNFQNFRLDFPARTKELLEQNENEPFTENEVTLLLNCCLAMLCLPLDNPDWRIQRACVDKLYELGVEIEDSGGDYEDARVLQNIRNAVAHLNVESNKDVDSKIIKTITFVSYNDETGDVTMEFTFTVSQLRDFAVFVAEQYIEVKGNA